MRVTIRHGAPGVCMSNILWRRYWPERRNPFPTAHPCTGNPKPTVFVGDEVPDTNDPLGLFRKRGYFASCFPEGDGIAFRPPEGKTEKEIEEDVRQCFGFEVDQ